MTEQSKVVLITGTSSGFGRIAAEDLAAKGHRVFAGMREITGRNRTRHNELLTRADQHGWSIEVLELDITDDDAVDSAVGHIIDTTGRIDVVINNAGTAWVGVTEAFTTRQAQQLFDTNVFGAMRINRAVLPHMRSRGDGLLMHVSSGVGRIVFPFSGLYSSSKWALEGYAEAMRYELAPLGIDVVIVEPGAFPTEIVTKAVAPAEPERAAEYGETAELGDNIGRKFGELFSGPHAPDPAHVVDAMIGLIDTPIGSRPLRTPVGRDAEPIAALNDLGLVLQRKTMEYFELEPLLATTPREGG